MAIIVTPLAFFIFFHLVVEPVAECLGFCTDLFFCDWDVQAIAPQQHLPDRHPAAKDFFSVDPQCRSTQMKPPETNSKLCSHACTIKKRRHPKQNIHQRNISYPTPSQKPLKQSIPKETKRKDKNNNVFSDSFRKFRSFP